MQIRGYAIVARRRAIAPQALVNYVIYSNGDRYIDMTTLYAPDLPRLTELYAALERIAEIAYELKS